MEYYARDTFTVKEWKQKIDDLIHLAVKKYGLDWNLDVHPNTKIYQQEIVKSNTILVYKDNTDAIGGFACIMTNKIKNCLYVTLLVSFCKGNGRIMLEYIATQHGEPHLYMAVRSPFETVGFYIKLGFNICNWNTLLMSYTSGDVDVQLTRKTQVNPNSIDQIIQRGWIPPGSTEYPLLACRSTPKDVTCSRRSERIVSKRARHIGSSG